MCSLWKTAFQMSPQILADFSFRPNHWGLLGSVAAWPYLLYIAQSPGKSSVATVCCSVWKKISTVCFTQISDDNASQSKKEPKTSKGLFVFCRMSLIQPAPNCSKDLLFNNSKYINQQEKRNMKSCWARERKGNMLCSVETMGSVCAGRRNQEGMYSMRAAGEKLLALTVPRKGQS